MDINLQALPGHIMAEFRKEEDPKQKGRIFIVKAADCLRKCKHLALSLLQINVLLGYSNPDKDGFFDYEAFVPECVNFI
jgi:hypothetical protein